MRGVEVNSGTCGSYEIAPFAPKNKNYTLIKGRTFPEKLIEADIRQKPMWQSRQFFPTLWLTILILFISCSQSDKNKNQTNNTMKFRASFCDPLKPDIIELGEIHQDKIMETFKKIPWSDFLDKMEKAKEDEIFYSPSLEIENIDSRHGLAISVVGMPDRYEFYIFYKRPKIVKTFFGLTEKMNENYLTDKTGQTEEDVLNCLNALIKNNTDYLADKIRQ